MRSRFSLKVKAASYISMVFNSQYLFDTWTNKHKHQLLANPFINIWSLLEATLFQKKEISVQKGKQEVTTLT